MTRYSNPLPHGQVPPTQGRPAGNGLAQHQPDLDPGAWPAAAPPRPASRPAPAQGYGGGDPMGYAAEPQLGYGSGADPQASSHHDLYAALRPDGYGYVQPGHQAPPPSSEAYGLAGYTAPQPAAQSYAPRAPQPPAPRPNYAPPPQAAYPPVNDGFGAGNGFGSANGFGGANGASGGHGAPAFAPQPTHHAPQPSHGYMASNAHGAGPASAYGAPSAPAPVPPSQSSAYAGFGVPSSSQGYGLGHADGAHAPLADTWGGQGLGAAHGLGGEQGLAIDPRDYGHYASSPAPDAQGHWGEPGDGYGEPHHLEPGLGANGYPAAHPQPQQGAFDQSYADDDLQYEEAPRRGGWKKVVGLVACTFLVGGVLTIAYSTIMGTNSAGPTPLVKGEAGPAKVKPSDPGGKQFAHTDSKIMGRLGDKGAEEADPKGVRKVPVVVVGRDGSIQPPAPAPEPTRAVVAVPGLTVIDGLDGPSAAPAAPKAPAAAKAAPAAPKAAAPAAPAPPVKMIAAAEADPAAKQKQPAAAAVKPLAAAEAKAPVAVPAKAETAALPKKEKVAAVPAATGPRPTGAGYVAVLASVPASGSSRIDALKQFADLQQRYGTILQNKTPDIQEANLGEKGTYHRLLVGPPGSRDSASSVCTQLKAEGYSGCWVTAY